MAESSGTLLATKTFLLQRRLYATVLNVLRGLYLFCGVPTTFWGLFCMTLYSFRVIWNVFQGLFCRDTVCILFFCHFWCIPTVLLSWHCLHFLKYIPNVFQGLVWHSIACFLFENTSNVFCGLFCHGIVCILFEYISNVFQELFCHSIVCILFQYISYNISRAILSWRRLHTF